MKILKYFLFTLMGGMAILATSCSENIPFVEEVPNVYVLTSINGVGDNSYNDMAMKGVMDFNEKNEVNLSITTPISMEEAAKKFRSWLTASEATDALSVLVLGSNEYESIVRNESFELKKNQKILLFETKSQDLPQGVYSFSIRRYGAAYLSGCMAREGSSAIIVSAMKNNPVLQEGIDGFKNGYESHSKEKVEIIYLADDESGFSQPNKAYELMSKINYKAFVYPLAGGSNNGIFKYTRDEYFSTNLIVGMDKDCSVYSTRIPYSVVMDINSIVEGYLQSLVNGENCAAHQDFGLGNGIDIYLNPTFYDDLIIGEDFYFMDDLYWEKGYSAFLSEAKEKESLYYDKN